MRKLFSKLAFTAGFALAMALTFSCHDGDGSNEDPPPPSDVSSSSGSDPALSSGSSSSNDGNIPLSSGSSSSNDDNIPLSSGSSSSSGGVVGNSSSSGGSSSSSSSGEGAVSSSSSSGGGGNSSSSGGSSSSSSSAEDAVSSSSSPSGGGEDKFTDSRDNTEYKLVKIGEQIWMAENLKYDAPGSQCYDYLTDNCNKYGRLYNWVMTMNNCPAGWHVPSDAEWTTLTNYIGSDAGKKLKADSVWAINALGTDNYGFAALPGGYASSNISFGDMGTNAYWWSATTTTSGSYVYYRKLTTGNGVISDYLSEKNYYSVRCVKGEPERPAVDSSSFVDTRDGISYKTVKIGVQRWMAENLKYKATDSKCYNNLAESCDKYGRLYQWNMATNGNESNQNPSGVKGACPTGWHIPSVGEWNTLTSYVGDNAGMRLKATDGWNGYNNGLDLYGFAALPGGYVGSDNSFHSMGTEAYWWSATTTTSGSYAYYRKLTTGNGVIDDYLSKMNYYSIRCVEDIEMP